jgi:hypothetical protein
MSEFERKDPRETEALISQAETELKAASDNWASLLLFKGVINKDQLNAVKDYLSNHDETILELSKRPGMHDTLRDLIFLSSVIYGDEIGRQRYKDIDEELLDHEALEKPEYDAIRITPLYIKEALAQLKVRLLVSRKLIGDDTALAEYYQYVADEVAHNCIRFGIPIPPETRAYVSDLNMKAYEALQEDVYSGKADQLMEETMRKLGLKPEEYTEEKMKEDEERERLYPQAAKELIEEYPDPTVLADKFLDIKAGKWPV